MPTIIEYVIGGVLVGLATTITFHLYKKPLGASSTFSCLLSYFSAKFRNKNILTKRNAQLLYASGFIIGAIIYSVITKTTFVTEIPAWRLVIGGFLVGLGTRMGRGCTSGHGVCGIASASKASVVATITFVVVAILTANIVGGLV